MTTLSLVQTEQPAAAKPPLAVDMDGTLIRNDLFVDGLVQFVLRNPLKLFTILGWLMKGRPYAKARIAENVHFDAATLPYDTRVTDYLRAEHAAGRKIVLATACDRASAQAVADHLGLFDAVLASDETTNNKGAAKAAALKQALGAFSYAGNDVADLDVWREAESAVIVNACHVVRSRAEKTTTIEAEFPRESAGIRALIRALRPHQWAKNALVFVPIITAHALLDIRAWISGVIVMAAFCLTASSIYLVNDLADLEADRRHPRKRKRPFAAGALSPAVGLLAAAALLTGGLIIGALAGALWVTAAYAAVSSLYTFRLKEMQLADVFTLAGLYTLRIFAGGEATGYDVSLWLLAFATFFFLSLALIKRTTELEGLREEGGALKRRGYVAGDQAMLKIMGVASSFTGCLVLALYMQSGAVANAYKEPAILWWMLPLMLFWSCRMWLLAQHGKMHDDPLVFALKDKTSWAVAAAGGLTMLLAAHDIPIVPFTPHLY